MGDARPNDAPKEAGPRREGVRRPARRRRPGARRGRLLPGRSRRAHRRLLDSARRRRGPRPGGRAPRRPARLRSQRGRDARDGRDHRPGPVRRPANAGLTAPILGRLHARGVGFWPQLAACATVRLLHNAATTAFFIWVIAGGLDAYAGTYDAIGRRIGIEVAPPTRSP